MAKRITAFLMTVFLSLTVAAPSFASVATSSNATPSNAEIFQIPALMSASESISTYSSFASVTNTVDLDYVSVYASCLDENGSVFLTDYLPVDSDGHFNIPASDRARSVRFYGIRLLPGALPALGKYRLQIDFASNIAIPLSGSFVFASNKLNKNATLERQWDTVSAEYVEYNDGDVYLDVDYNLSSFISFLSFVMYCEDSGGSLPVNGDLSISFTRLDSSASVDYSSLGVYSSEEIEADLADSSSQTAENTSRIADAIENLASDFAASMEPHYDNILTQLHHITEQLHAFWDQLAAMYKDTILPHMTDQTDRIIDALGNMTGLGSTVNSVAEKLMANDNRIHEEQLAADEANTEEVKDSIEKHGNFIIEGLKSLFIPSDDYFKVYFDDLHSWFSEKLGFLMFPIDLILQVADIFLGSSDVDCILTLPSFSIQEYELWAEYSFNLTEFLETHFSFLLTAIRFVTSVALIVMFVQYCERKWEEVMAN